LTSRTATYPATLALPQEFEPQRLGRRAAQVSLIIAVLVLVAMLAPGLGDVRGRLGDPRLGWLALEVLLLMFRPIFWQHMSRRTARVLALSAPAVGALMPASGAAALALRAWVLRESGMRGGQIARRSVALFLIKSSVNFFAVAVVATLAALGLGAERSPMLTVLPATVYVALIAAVITTRRLGAGGPRAFASSRARR
jgi:hypothetical protein